MKILIIEDEEPAARKLEQMILVCYPDYRILDRLRSVEAAVEWLNVHEAPDLLFLDIHLLDGTCFDILKQKEITCPVIFTTAYDTYALEAFQVNSIDYLLKPINQRKLEHAFRKLEVMRAGFSKEIQQARLDEVVHAMDAPEQQSYKSRFLVKYGTRFFSVPIEQVSYFFSEDRITYLVLSDGKKYAIGYSLDELESLLAPKDFFRINRQMILKIDCIRMVHRHFKGRLKVEIAPEPEMEVMVSSRRAADFQAWMDG